MWKTITDCVNYEVSDEGLVRNRRTKRILSMSDNGHGVLKVILSIDGEHVTKSVARLVGDAFVPDYEPGYVIFYNDNNPENVAADNLRWTPRWFAQEWAYQLKRDRPMRPWPIRMNLTGIVYENSLECAMQTFGIERYIVLACINGDTYYNRSTYDWIKE